MTTVQPFEITDLFNLSNVNLDILTENFPLEFYLEYLILWPDLFFKTQECTSRISHKISQSDDDILATSGYMMGKTEGKGQDWHAHITAVTVAPSFRRMSLASRLCGYLERIADSKRYAVNFIDLFVKCNNTLAINLYEKLGYLVYRRVIGYYNSAEDGYPKSLKHVDDNKDAFDMRKGMERDKGKSVRKDGRKFKCYPHDVRF